VLIVVLVLCGLAHGQQPDDPEARRQGGITLYEQGKDKEAVKVLEAFVKQYAMDSRAWHYLGLALGRMGKSGEARKAHEASVRNATQLTNEYIDGRSSDIFCVMVNPLRTMLTEAADSADKYLELTDKPSASKVEEWHARKDGLGRYLDMCPKSGNIGNKSVEPPDNNGAPTVPRILVKPDPQYTDEARLNGTQGTVVLFMMFAEDGIVKAIVPIVSLPNGLTAESIKAARRIQFVPANKNGKPVSSFIRVEYNFSIY